MELDKGIFVQYVPIQYITAFMKIIIADDLNACRGKSR